VHAPSRGRVAARRGEAVLARGRIEAQVFAARSNRGGWNGNAVTRAFERAMPRLPPQR